VDWKPRLFKPKWEHGDSTVRLAAVSAGQDPQLIEKLLEIAATDPDTRVRCAAIQRIHRLENILKLHAGETAPEAKELLLERIRQLAGSCDTSRPPLDLRLKAVEQSADKKLIEHLAVNAPEADLRRKAIGMVQRQGLLGDCCIGDDDPENRRAAARRIEQHTTLRRVITGLRTRDKDLYQHLQQRLHEELLAQGDPAAVGTEALNLCLALEKRAVERDTAAAADTDELHAAWQKISAKVPEELAERYRRVCQRLAAPPPSAPAAHAEQPPETAAEPETGIPAKVKDEALTAPDTALRTALDAIANYRSEHAASPAAKDLASLGQRLEKAWKAIQRPHPDDGKAHDEALVLLAELNASQERQQRKSAQALERAREDLAQLQQELDDGELHKALERRARLLEQLKEHSHTGPHRRDWQKIRSSLQARQGRLRELRDWLHWSNNKIRKRLIREMEVLPRADLHPDALINRVKGLQTEWRTLEESEQIPGDKHFAAAPWMWRKFNAAGHAAFETAKPFLDKRSEVQARHARSLATFCAELEQLATAEPPDWTALGKAIGRGRRKMRTLGDIPAAERQKFAHDLKAALDRATAVMQTHYGDVEKDKLKLIRKASALIHVEDRDEAITEAKHLQAQWKSAGSLWRGKEQTLWKQFRSYLDPLFEELKEEQDRLRAADEEKVAKQRALCDELAAILGDSDDLAGQQGKVQGLADQWNDIHRPDRKIQKTFEQLLQDYRAEVEKHLQREQHRERERLWRKSELLHEIVQQQRQGGGTTAFAERIQADWPAERSDTAAEQALDRCFEAWLQDPAAPVAAGEAGDLAERARLLCIQLEFLAGLPSPEAESQQRMQYQVDRLAQSMSGSGERRSAQAEAGAAEHEWLNMFALPDPDYSAFGERVKRALTSIEEST